MQKLKVLLLVGGGGSEHQVSLSSGSEVKKNLDNGKYDVIEMVMDSQQLDLAKVKQINPDVVFIALHGGVGEDGTLQNIFEENSIKFIGSGSAASKLGMNKIDFLDLMIKNHLPVPEGIIANKGDLVDLDRVKELGGKWVVKPTNQGSSVGVSIVDDLNKLDAALDLSFEYGDKTIIEEFLPGTEVSCGILGNNNPLVLPIIEICPKNVFFDFEAKYTDGKCEEIVPARLSQEITQKIQEQSLKVFQLTGSRGFVRIDFIVKNGTNPVILEMNTIPGLTPNSLLPKEANAAGITYPEMLDKMINLALE